MKSKAILLAAAVSGMELSCWYAVFNYLCIGFFHRNCPVSPLVFSFLAGAAVTGLLRGRGLRRIVLLGVHAAGYVLAVFLTVKSFHAPESPFYQFDWLSMLFSRPNDLVFWFALIFETTVASLLWFRGVALARSKPDYESVIRRFDLCLSMIFGLFLIKFIIRIRFQVQLPDPASVVLIFIFFVSGLLGLALARTQNRAAAGFQSSSLGVGFAMTAAVLALIVCSGAVGFFLSPMVSVAEGGYRLLAAAAKPVVPVIIGFLRLWLGPREFRMDRPSATTSTDNIAGQQMPEGPAAGFMDMVLHILAWTGAVLVCIVVLAGICFLLYWLWIYLMSRTPGSKRSSDFRTVFLNVFSLLPALIRKSVKNVFEVLSGAKDPVGLYSRLIRWGKMCGVRGPAMETPREYGKRLSMKFPEMGNEFMKIVHALEKQVYSGKEVENGEFRDAAKALGRLKSPVLWPMRLKAGLSRLVPSSPGG